jgi:signal transduction histidine kinase
MRNTTAERWRKLDDTTWVDLHIEANRLTLQIKDNGIGFDLNRKKDGTKMPFGVARMQELAKTLGTTLQIKSKLGQGTMIKVVFVVREVSNENTHPSADCG